MLYKGLDVILRDGSGFIFNTLLLELFILLVFVQLSLKIVKPVVRYYIIAKELERVATNPKPHWLFGHIKHFGDDSHERMLRVANISNLYPTMFNFWRGPFLSSLQVFHPDVIQPVIASGAAKDPIGYSLIRPWLGDGLLTSAGEKWKRHRMLLTPAFHFSILKPYMQVSNQTSHVLVEKWKGKTNQPLDVSRDVSLMTLDTMVQCAMSTKTDCQLTEGENLYIKTVRDVARAMIARLRNPIYLIDWIFKLSKHGKVFYNGVDILHKEADKIISARRNVLESSDKLQNNTGTNKKMVDFLDILLKARDEDGKGLTDQEIRDEVDTFLFEGISWALYNLAKYEEFQEKCREEVQSICRDEEDVEWDDLSKMTYLTMFLKESMRLYPPVSFVGKLHDKPIKMKSKHNTPPESDLPAGSSIGISMLALHRNSLLWEDPDKFDPERFTSDNCAKRNPLAYIPFSAGSRNCIGQNFAMNEMKVVLAQILRNFKLYLDEETPEPKLEFRIILQSENGFFVKLKKLEA